MPGRSLHIYVHWLNHENLLDLITLSLHLVLIESQGFARLHIRAFGIILELMAFAAAGDDFYGKHSNKFKLVGEAGIEPAGPDIALRSLVVADPCSRLITTFTSRISLRNSFIYSFITLMLSRALSYLRNSITDIHS